MSYDKHKIHQELGVEEFDAFIAGSGPIGALYARCLVDQGYNVCMVEMGDQDTRVPAAHKKNEIEYQKDIDRFVKVIQGALSTVSIPVTNTIMPTLDPSAWQATDPEKRIISNGRNFYQKDHNNLGAQAVTRGVGGMTTHWTCATPEFLKGIERPVIFTDSSKDDAEWKLLYDAARSIIGTSEHEYDHSIRHNIVLQTLQKAYPNRGVKNLPLACHRIAEGSPYVQWHAADNVYYDLFTNPEKKNQAGVQRGKFGLVTNTRCTKFILSTENVANPQIKLVEVKDLLEDRLDVPPEKTNFYIQAKTYIVAAGAVATPQILANSGWGGRRDQNLEQALIPQLGIRITEQPMAFCQIVLHQELVEDAGKLDDKPDWWQRAVRAHQAKHPLDPLPIPFQDGEPQVTIPFSKDFPWHTQIHRDAFSYGEAGPRVDSRVVVDLRFFGAQHGVPENRLLFENNLTDAYGMPQPTFEYTPTRDRAHECSRMMHDMTDAANKLGGYLPGSNPQFMTPGLALHLGGTTRLGLDDKESVANFNSQVWKFANLYVGGNGLIPTPFGANPTLTSMCLALRSAYKISQDLKNGTLTPALPTDTLTPTPPEWVNWALDKNDVNFPDHRKLRELHRRVGNPGRVC